MSGNKWKDASEIFYFYFLIVGTPLGLLWVWLVIFPSVFHSWTEAAPHYILMAYCAFSFGWNWWKTCALGPGHIVGGAEITGKDDKTWCEVCQCIKPERSHHCAKCGVCVLQRDHHCGYLRTCIGLRNQGRFIIGLSYFVAMGSHVMPLGFQHLYSVLAARDLLTWTLIPKLFLFHLAVPFGYIDSLAVVNVHLTAFGCLAWLVAVYVFWRQLRLVLYGLTGFEMDRGQEKGEFAWANVRKVFGRHVVLAWLWPFYVLPGDEDVVRRRGNK